MHITLVVIKAWFKCVYNDYNYIHLETEFMSNEIIKNRCKSKVQ